jgi:NitT/TauT family transport system substrate-binding protein
LSPSLRTLLASFLLPIVLLPLAIACGDDDDEPGEPVEVTMGYIPILIFAPVFVGIERGYFEEEGIILDLQRLEGGADMLVQTAAGNFDIGGGGVGVALFNAAATALDTEGEVPFEVVAPLHSEREPVTTPLVVSKRRFDAGEITSVADLAGKQVSINARGAATEYWLERALQSGGLSMADIELTEVGFGNVAAALDNGSIDGAMLGEPLVTLAEDQGLVHVLAEDFVDGDQPTAIYWNRGWAESNPDLAEGFLRAYERAVEDLRDGGWEDPELHAIIEQYTEVPAAVIARAAHPFQDVELNLDGFKAQEEFFRGQGLLTYEDELDFATFMRTD